MEGEGLGIIYHVNDVSVYLGRQRGGGVPDRKDAFCACVLHFEPRAVRFSLRERFKLQHLGQKLQDQASSLFFRRGPLPSSVYLGDTDVIHVINDTRPSPSVFTYCK